jgi:deaminated glutathione amidase
VKVALLQMAPGSDRAANLARAEALIGRAVAEHAPDLISLPEMWTCLGGDRETKWAQAEVLPAPDAASAPGSARAFLAEAARRHRIVMHGGSIGERDGERLFNTTLLFGRDGQEVARYRKIHLFDVTTPNGQGYRESASFGAGGDVVTAAVDGTVLGLSICYDLRFPELYRALRLAGAEVLFVPSAFTAETGRDHWEVLLRARAIETQCWVVAAATVGEHRDARGEPRLTHGHSMVCDPWGRVVAERREPGEGVVAARIDPEAAGRVRGMMPVMAHRRLGLAAP